MYPFWPLSGALQLPKWCMLITEMAHPIYRISGALTLPKSGALSVTDYNPFFIEEILRCTLAPMACNLQVVDAAMLFRPVTATA